MKNTKRIISLFLAAALIFLLAGCAGTENAGTQSGESQQATTAETQKETAAQTEKETAASSAAADQTTETIPAPEADTGSADHVIVLSSTENSDGTWTHRALFDGEEVTEYDYTWNCDINEDHEDVKNAPAEYYTGSEPGDEAGAVYIAHDIFYYPEIPEENFQLVNYDGEQEWACYYPESSAYKDYIFGTLPAGITMGGGKAAVPTQMMHSAEDASKNAKLHITEPGSYSIEGTWHGQIWIDLGDQDETFADENAKVKLYLNGVDVTCTVAPALVFYSVYECDNGWEEREIYTKDVDTENAGAVVVLADGTVNNLNGTNIFRMLKTKLKDEEDTSEVPVQKKVRKTDAAVYSYRTMNIEGQEEGTGVLNVTSGFEGLDTELHLSINGGNVNIYSQDDGLNCNEDGVSVVAFNGGSVHILAGLGTEGDGVDSNGFLVVNGGTVVSMANPASDSGLDSDCGSYVNGGTVLALGSTMDWAEADDSNTASAVTMNLRFAVRQNADEAIIVTDTDGRVVFAYDPDKDEIASGNARTYQGAVISSDNFEIGKEYKVYVGGDVTGTEIAGMYDATTVTGFSDEAVQQGYSGQDGFGFGGMGQPPQGGEMPSMAEGETPPEPPTGANGKPDAGKGENSRGGQPPQGGGQPGQGDGKNPPEKPAGEEQPSFAEGEQPSMPENGSMPADFDPSKMPEGGTPGFGGEGEKLSSDQLTVVFLMEDSVNNFSGVQDCTD